MQYVAPAVSENDGELNQIPGNVDPTKVEEIKKTIYVGNLDSKTATAEQLLQFFSTCGEVRFVRMAGDETQPTRFAFVEFADTASVQNALNLNGMLFGDRPIKVNHSNNAIVKPQNKTQETTAKEIEEAMRRVKEAQSLISKALEPESNDRRRSRSRSRHKRRRSRSGSGSRRRRSRSRDRRRRRSRSRSHGRSKSRRSSSRSRRHRRSRSRSHKRSRSRKRSRSKKRDRSSSKRRGRSKSKSRSKSPSKRSSRHKKDRKRDRERDKDRDRKRKRKSRSRSSSQEGDKKKEQATKGEGKENEKEEEKKRKPAQEKKTAEKTDSAPKEQTNGSNHAVTVNGTGDDE